MTERILSWAGLGWDPGGIIPRCAAQPALPCPALAAAAARQTERERRDRQRDLKNGAKSKAEIPLLKTGLAAVHVSLMNFGWIITDLLHSDETLSHL